MKANIECKDEKMDKIRNFLHILFFSHHPLCKSYEDDVIAIKNLKLCTGCYIALPIMLLTLIIVPLTIFYRELPFNTLFILGFIIAIFYVVFKLPFGNKKHWQYISKILVGIGGGLIISSFDKLPLTPTENDILKFLIQFLVVWSHLILRGIVIYQTCKKCKYDFNWEECPGFRKTGSLIFETRSDDRLDHKLRN